MQKVKTGMITKKEYLEMREKNFADISDLDDD
jgi:hypothetical protein